MTNEEIVKELREVIDCIANEEPITATRTALTIIEKLKPKPLFVLGPAKYRDGTDCNILAIHTNEDQCLLTEYKEGKEGNGWWVHRHRLDGTCSGNSWKNVMPNNESDEKVYGPQECNKTAVKTCENCNGECNGETAKCFACHNYSEWAPAPTDKELWDRVLAVEKAHKDFTLPLGCCQVAGSKKELRR